MTIKAIGTKIGTGRASPLVLAVLAVVVAGCSGNNNSSASATLAASTFSPASAIQSSASIIALDPVNQAIWVPSYTLDANGNLQYELISTAAAVSNGTATGFKTVSMTGCDTPVGIAYASSISALLVECGNSTTLTLYLSAVDASSLAVTPIATPGLSWNGNYGAPYNVYGSYGGIIYNPQNSQAFIAGSTNIGLLQVPAGGRPSFEANSVTAMPIDPYLGIPVNVASMAMNFTTQQVIITPAGPSVSGTYNTAEPPYVVETSIINTIAPALNITELPYITESNGNAISYQGAAFDSATGVLALSGDFSAYRFSAFFNTDVVGVLSMDSYNASGPSVDSVLVNGFVDYYTGPFNVPLGTTEGAIGGLAALNPATHQVLVGDAWGPNLLLIQLPSLPLGPEGNLDNYGQPTTTGVASTPSPDPKSAYAIAQTLVSVQTAGQSNQLNAIANPPALVIDSVNNIAYVLADNSTTGPHDWNMSTGITLALVSLDLSAPVPGACPSLNNVVCAANWYPRTAQVVIP